MSDLPLLVACTGPYVGPKVPMQWRRPTGVTVSGLIPPDTIILYALKEGEVIVVKTLSYDGKETLYPDDVWGCKEFWAERIGTSSEQVSAWLE